MSAPTSHRSTGRRPPALVACLCTVGLALTSTAPAVRAQEPAEAQPTPDSPQPDQGSADRLPPEQLYINFVHFVMLGRYDIAQAYGQNLLDHPGASPDVLLEAADQQVNSREALTWALSNPKVGPTARRILDLIARGELNRRKEATRINAYIEGLGQGARAELNNAERLRNCGEYAVPWLIKTLQDPKRTVLHARIVRTLPKIGKAAVNPLCAALEMKDPLVKQTLIRALGRMGYSQAVPYLKVLLEDPQASDDVRTAAADAVAQILTSDRPMFSMNAAEAMFNLAGNYWINSSGVRADAREPETNVWYWREGFLRPVAVPTAIYDEVMAMRACETALRLDPGHEPALALWLAANFRREAELGMNVESEEPDPARQALDRTRPADFLRGIYFARSAGPRLCHQVLDRALYAGNSAVALGAIAALEATAGADTLVGVRSETQPLVQALVFPSLAVRIKAALAIGRALPTTRFDGADNVVPVLADALAQTGRRHAVVVDRDQPNRNRIAGLLGEEDVNTVAAANLLEALARARKLLPNVDVIFLASDVAKPGLAEALSTLKRDFRFASTPLILLAKPGDEEACTTAAVGEQRIGIVPADAPKVALIRRWEETAARVGRVPLGADEALDLALKAADVLYRMALTHSPVFAVERAENALIQALRHPGEELRIKAAAVLAMIASSPAQSAIATAALNPDNEMSLRLPAFASLAESAKRHGNMLSEANLETLLQLTTAADDPVIRTNASRALGALNLPVTTASKIILGG